MSDYESVMRTKTDMEADRDRSSLGLRVASGVHRLAFGKCRCQRLKEVNTPALIAAYGIQTDDAS
jgi:hypothetical protein